MVFSNSALREDTNEACETAEVSRGVVGEVATAEKEGGEGKGDDTTEEKEGNGEGEAEMEVAGEGTGEGDVFMGEGTGAFELWSVSPKVHSPIA